MEKALTKSRFRGLAPITALVAALTVWMATGNSQAYDETSFLHPEQRHENVGELVTQIVEKSHYNRVSIDDDFSSEVLDNFVESLDRNRMYLLKADVEHFEELRYLERSIGRTGVLALSLEDVWAGPREDGFDDDQVITWRVEGTSGVAKGSIGWPTGAPSAPEAANKVSLLGVGGKKKKGDKASNGAKKRSPGEIRIQKGEGIIATGDTLGCVAAQ